MQDRTPLTWNGRAERLGIKDATISRATGYSVRAIRAYRQGTRGTPAEFLFRVDDFLTSVELAVNGGTAA